MFGVQVGHTLWPPPATSRRTHVAHMCSAHKCLHRHQHCSERLRQVQGGGAEPKTPAFRNSLQALAAMLWALRLLLQAYLTALAAQPLLVKVTRRLPSAAATPAAARRRTARAAPGYTSAVLALCPTDIIPRRCLAAGPDIIGACCCQRCHRAAPAGGPPAIAAEVLGHGCVWRQLVWCVCKEELRLGCALL